MKIKDNSIVTICCFAYNHEKYIKDTLEGFVNQNTKYRYKIIVHDDASTDKTCQIIEDYVKKYPEMFIPIYQKENQYSKGIDIFKTYIMPCIDTKYIAVCEGDDYWCDKNKIQFQIDFLEKHEDCSLCVHNTEKIDEKGNLLNEFFNFNNNITIYTTENIIKSCGQPFFHFSSFVFRTSVMNEMPNLFREFPVGDFSLALYMSLRGEICYLPFIMSRYRVGAVNSWTELNKKNIQRAYDNNCKMIDALRKFDSYTSYIFTSEINRIIIAHKYNIIKIKGEWWKVFYNYKFLILWVKNMMPHKLKYYIKRIWKQ